MRKDVSPKEGVRWLLEHVDIMCSAINLWVTKLVARSARSPSDAVVGLSRNGSQCHNRFAQPHSVASPPSPRHRLPMCVVCV